MTCNFGGKKYMQIKTKINGQEVIIIPVEPTCERFKQLVKLERELKYDAITKPIKNNIYPIEKHRRNKNCQSSKNFKGQ